MTFLESVGGYLGRRFGPDEDERVPYWPQDWSDVPRAVLDLLQRTLARIAGIAFLLTAALLAAALLSYSPLDPAIDHATGQAPRNALGSAGAALAEWVLTWLAIPGWMAVVPLAAWGAWTLEGRPVLQLPKRIAAAALSILLLCIGGAALAAYGIGTSFATVAAGGCGGLLGHVSLYVLGSMFGFAGLDMLTHLAGLLAGLAGVWLYLWAAGLNPFSFSPSEVGEVSGRAWSGPAHVFGLVSGFAAAGMTRVTSLLGRRTKPSRATDPEMDADDDGQVDEDEDFGADDVETGETPPVASKDSNGRKEPVLIEPRIMRPAAGKGKAAAKAAEPATPEAKADYELPPLTLLSKPKDPSKIARDSDEVLEQNARQLEAVLSDFGVRGRITHVRPGPVVTLYELEPAAGIRSSRVISLADDIARNMSAVSARVAAVPGRNVIGIELPNQKRETVLLRDLFSCGDYEAASQALTLALGKNIGGEPVLADLARMPHLLIAGTTGSGKSVAINTMILSLLYRLTPAQCRLIMIDPKMLELSVYDDIPHLLTPVVTDPKKAVVALKWTVKEMEDRYRRMSKLGVRNILGFNERVAKAAQKGEKLTRTVQTGFDPSTGQPMYESEDMSLEHMPYIVVIVDEMADLMLVAGKDIEGAVQRLAQMARAAGIHIIMATQRPSVDVITGTIKANFPTRISFQVTSKIDSRTILGEQGAEQLLGQGDMLYMEGGGRIRRLHGPFVSDSEVVEIVKFLKTQGTPEYLDSITEEPDEPDPALMLDGEGEGGDSDDLYDKAVAIVARDRKVSTSYVQRRLQIGYNRAARIIERMEEEGVISGPNHSGKREVLVGDHSG